MSNVMISKRKSVIITLNNSLERVIMMTRKKTVKKGKRQSTATLKRLRLNFDGLCFEWRSRLRVAVD